MLEDKDVSGDGWISDESDFYGTPTKRRRLEVQSRNVKFVHLVRAWQKQQQISPIGSVAIAQPRVDKIQPLYNEYEENEAGRQLSETIFDFIRRMPPLTSHGDGSWIWIANPILRGKGNGSSRPRSQLGAFEEVAPVLISQFMSDRTRVENENHGKVQSTITRKLGPYRDKLKEDILDTAIKYGVTSGKWMLFPTEEEVTSTWRIVCEAVINDTLGTAAKVAVQDHTRNPAPNSVRRRLICIYTRDFSDLDDVRRVLDELVELGLAPREGNGIYYKCDAYTYLGIESDNPFKLKAGLYSSRELLKTAKSAERKTKQAGAASGTNTKKQGGLEDWDF